MLLREAQKNNFKEYAPCSSAWQRVRCERPDLELHNLPDRTHPGTLGTYLNMCCFYAAFTGLSPAGLPAEIKVWPRFGAFDKDQDEKRLQNARLGPYHAVMPAWMQKISVMQWTESVDAETAEYLQHGKRSWKKMCINQGTPRQQLV